MSGAFKLKSESFQDLLETLSDLKNGKLSRRAKYLNDAKLDLVVDRINELAAILEAKAQEQGEGSSQSPLQTQGDFYLRKLINSVPDLLGYWNLDLQNIHANNVFYYFFGKTPAEVRGKNIFEVIGNELFLKHEAQFRAVLMGYPQVFEIEIPLVIGRGMRPCMARFLPDIIDRQVVGFFTVITDLTEIKKMDQQYKAVVETMAEGMLVQNEKGQIIQFNKAALTILGLTEEELSGSTAIDPHWKYIREDGSDFPSHEHPANVALKTGKPVMGVIMGLQLPNGERNWIKINAQPFETSKNLREMVEGAEAYKKRVICTFTDVTFIKEREAELRFINDSLKIGIWKFNPSTQSLEWDKNMYELFDVPEREFSGDYTAWESCLTPESKEKAIQELNSAMRGEKDFNTVFEIKTLRNGRRFISGRSKIDRDQNGQPLLMYGINMDCTDEVMRQQELERLAAESRRNAKLASLGELSAGIAHEINNPLTIIDGSVELLTKFKDNPEKFTAKIEAVKKATHRIGRIVQSLKKFSRSDNKSIYRVHLMREILTDALVLTEVKAKRGNTTVTLESSTTASIYCDYIEIEQVVVNLITNGIDAVKDRPEKWVKIEQTEEGSKVVLRVTDSGVGIPENIRQKIFDPFFTTKKTGEGTGLGLSITKGILDEHKATINVLENVPNTCFEIRFEKNQDVNHVR